MQGRMYDVFHISMLEPYVENNIPGRSTPPPPPVGDDLDRYEAEEILESRKKGRKVGYLIQQIGYGPDNRTWEVYENLISDDGDILLLREFFKKYITKLRDMRIRLQACYYSRNKQYIWKRYFSQ